MDDAFVGVVGKHSAEHCKLWYFDVLHVEFVLELLQ